MLVAVDVHLDSPTSRRHVAVELSEECRAWGRALIELDERDRASRITDALQNSAGST